MGKSCLNLSIENNILRLNFTKLSLKKWPFDRMINILFSVHFSESLQKRPLFHRRDQDHHFFHRVERILKRQMSTVHYLVQSLWSVVEPIFSCSVPIDQKYPLFSLLCRRTLLKIAKFFSDPNKKELLCSNKSDLLTKCLFGQNLFATFRWARRKRNFVTSFMFG